MIVTIIATMAMMDSIDNGGSEFDTDRVSVPWPINICFAPPSTTICGIDIPLLVTCAAILHGIVGSTIKLERQKRWRRIAEDDEINVPGYIEVENMNAEVIKKGYYKDADVSLTKRRVKNLSLMKRCF
jgi:hypothetical protein